MLPRLLAGVDRVIQAAFGPRFMPFGPGTEEYEGEPEDDESSLDEILLEELFSDGDEDGSEDEPPVDLRQEDDGYPD